MCARFAQAGSTLATSPFPDLTELWRAGGLPARYNIAPTQTVPVVRARENGDGLRADLLRWGLIPSWAKERGIGNKLINARSETAATKPAFRAAFASRRCVVPASGFFEWRAAGHGKEPHYIFRSDGELMLMAGLWERWRDSQAESVETFTILTCPPNTFMERLHDRMPVILEVAGARAWLASDQEPVQPLLVPAEDGTLDSYTVSSRVNSVRHDDAACLDRVSIPGLFD